MSKNNFFFKFTDTEEKYTEKYLVRAIEEILSKEVISDFNSLYEKILEMYSDVKINRSALFQLATTKFHVNKSINKIKPEEKLNSGKRNYFFRLQNSDEQHTEEYLIKEIASILREKPLTKENLYEEIIARYNNEKINFSAFKNLLADKFLYKDKKYHLNPDLKITINAQMIEKDKEYVAEKLKYVSALQQYVSYSNEELYRDFYGKLEKSDKPIMDVIFPVMATEIKKGVLNVEKCAEMCIFINRNIDEYLLKIKTAIENIGVKYGDVTCAAFVRNESIQKLFGAYGILTADDFRKADPKVILILSCIDLEGTITGIESIAEGYYAKICNTIKEVISDALKGHAFEVLLQRNGYFTDKEETLEDLGKKYGLTRERIRQIEVKGNRKLSDCAQNFWNEVKGFFDLLIKSEGVLYKRVKKLLESNEDKDSVYRACLLLQFANINYKYDERYHLIYDSDVITVKDLEDQLKDEYGKLIAVSRYDTANELEKEIINNNYTLSGRLHNLYIQKHYSKTDFVIDLIDELFPDGYRQYNEDDYSKLAKNFVNKLGDDVEAPTKDAIRGIINRDDVFCQVDRGTYKLRRECAEIPLELFNDIFDFIVDHLPAVYYITIYEYFEHELNKLGITNYYYMKGVLDYLLPDDLTTKRDYITETDNRISAVEARVAFMRSFPGAFTFDDLQEKYPGVKPYVFQFLCYEEANNGLVQIGTKKFIYFEHLNISDKHIVKTKEIIEELFKNADSKILSSRKVYAKIKLSYPELLKDLPFIEDHFSMFSIIKQLFANDYYFNRPYISKEKPDSEKITTSGIVLRYLEKFEKVNYDIYRNYCMKMNISMPYSYMQLVDELSDNYVQINDRQMIRKQEFAISEGALRDIDRILELIFSKVDKIETSKFNGYVMLPQIKIKWNKHVFAGIIRSYFSEKYEVINITDGLKAEAVDYEIERYVV